MTWRQGEKVPNHLYRQAGSEPDTRPPAEGGDPWIGSFVDPDEAARAVAAVNGETADHDRAYVPRGEYDEAVDECSRMDRALGDYSALTFQVADLLGLTRYAGGNSDREATYEVLRQWCQRERRRTGLTLGEVAPVPRTTNAPPWNPLTGREST